MHTKRMLTAILCTFLTPHHFVTDSLESWNHNFHGHIYTHSPAQGLNDPTQTELFMRFNGTLCLQIV